jgi:transcriptional regulator with XRE-family HTH domain
LQEIGNLLRKERQEKGISLEEISRETKIQARYLRALEDGDFSCFAGTVYIKGALRNYAESIGLNADELILYYKEVTNGQKNEEDSQKSKSELLMDKERHPFPFVALIWIALLAVIIGGSIWFRSQGNLEGERPFLSQGHVSGDQILDDNEIEGKEVEPFPGVVEKPEDLPQLAQLSFDKREAVYLLSGVERMEIILYFTKKCWAEIEQDGAYLEQKNFLEGDERVLPASSHETKIRLGNPPGARLEVNGLLLNDWHEVPNPFNIIIRRGEH